MYKTKCQQDLINLLSFSKTPLSANQIIEQLKNSLQSYNPATVYRTITRLQQAQLIKQVLDEREKERYFIINSIPENRVIFSCTNCKSFQSYLVPTQLQKELKQFSSNISHIRIQGSCQQCTKP
jgi:Fe2+ or Zn2+ uptake regulation protein